MANAVGIQVIYFVKSIVLIQEVSIYIVENIIDREIQPAQGCAAERNGRKPLFMRWNMKRQIKFCISPKAVIRLEAN